MIPIYNARARRRCHRVGSSIVTNGRLEVSVTTIHRAMIAILATVLVAASFRHQPVNAAAQPQGDRNPQNPRAADPLAVSEGGAMFRTFCAACHGVDARGGTRGPDLTTGRWTHGGSDAAIFATIMKGVPGTEMPPAVLDEPEVWGLVAFLRSLAATAAPPVAGDRAAGEQLFFGDAGCSRCHMVSGRGGRLGPELSRIGAARAPAVLSEAIRLPSVHLAKGFETVRVVTSGGAIITGVLR